MDTAGGEIFRPRRIVRIVGAAVTIIVSAAVATVIALIIADSKDAAELRSCHRLNIHRVADDNNSYADWKVLTLVVEGQKSARIPSAQRQAAAKFYSTLTRDIDSKTWTPLTNCHQAVYSNAKPPQPIRFSMRQPTKKDLTITPGN